MGKVNAGIKVPAALPFMGGEVRNMANDSKNKRDEKKESDNWQRWEDSDRGKRPSERLRAATHRYRAHNDTLAARQKAEEVWGRK